MSSCRSTITNVPLPVQAFHDRVRVFKLRAQLEDVKKATLQELEVERARRSTFKVVAAQARARRKALRADIRRAYEFSRDRTQHRCTTIPPLP